MQEYGQRPYYLFIHSRKVVTCCFLVPIPSGLIGNALRVTIGNFQPGVESVMNVEIIELELLLQGLYGSSIELRLNLNRCSCGRMGLIMRCKTLRNLEEHGVYFRNEWQWHELDWVKITILYFMLLKQVRREGSSIFIRFKDLLLTINMCEKFGVN